MQRVDVINTFCVSAGRFAYFRVVSRSQIQRLRSSARFLKGVRFPAAPPVGNGPGHKSWPVFFPHHVNWSRRRGRGLAPRRSFPADDEGLDVVPAIAVGGLRDALLEFSEEVGEEAGSACLALAREGTEEAAVRTALRRYRPTGPACSPCATAEGPRTSPRVCSALWLSPSLLRAVACAAEVWHQDTSRIRHVRRSKTWPSARSPL